MLLQTSTCRLLTKCFSSQSLLGLKCLVLYFGVTPILELVEMIA